MKSSSLYVFDTNVIVSALIFEHSKPGRAFRYALQMGQVLLSLPVLEELNEVVSREKFAHYVTTEEREVFLEALVVRSEFVNPKEEIKMCRDPKDDKFLELAVAGRANYIVTGDDDLLTLNPFRDIGIVTVDDFLALIVE